MKKRKDWSRKSLRRLKKREDRGIVDFMRIKRHFFGDLNRWMEELPDPRNQSYITYTQRVLINMGILKQVCALKSMRQMEEAFNEETCIDTLGILSGDCTLEEMPHYDTLNNYLERLPGECLSGLRKKMVKSLLRGRQFYSARLLGKYWRIIIDGTGLFCFKERHCGNCLCQTRKDENGKTVRYYYHKVLEAKLVLGENLVISIGTEFIENEAEDADKQDCEINAAKRLLARIKDEYPRLPVCLQGDALYDTEPMMEICRKNGWKYIFTQKEGRQRQVAENYALLREGKEVREVIGIGKEKGRGSYYNHIEDLAGKKEAMNLYDYSYEKVSGGNSRNITFQWISNIDLTGRNLEEMIWAGRGRWKIENEGFNNQKNGVYRIGHLNSRNSNAMKNHYLLTQIADILMQLYLAWNPYIKELGQTIKNTSYGLLESFRRTAVTAEDVSYICRYTTVYLE